MSRVPLSSSKHRRTRGFTLAELLVVMGVVGVLSTLTLVSIRVIAKDARLSSATNTVMAALDNARALAMKRNKPVLVAFYPRVEGMQSRVDIITAAWTGGSLVVDVGSPGNSTSSVFDRFRPVSDVPIRSLPPRVKVAGPAYADDRDDLWLVMTELTRPNEPLGQLVGVMYGPDGSTLLGNSANDSDYFWIDLNGSGDLEMDLNVDGVVNPVDPADRVFAMPPVDPLLFFQLGHPEDEVAINIVPFVAVFDETDARDRMGDNDWDVSFGTNRDDELTQYIVQYADRIHFNRYTGVAMR
ncbi:MAG: prepilin-type N-terminal cleavage/methylation domain-containing protein [Planctomycetota bacterium]|jgi:prepilin-type N-terminal cleavage/methylation domain-containing protein